MGPQEMAPMLPEMVMFGVVCCHDTSCNVEICSVEKTLEAVDGGRWQSSQEPFCGRGKWVLNCERKS